MLSETLKYGIAEACVSVGAGDVLGRGVLVGGQFILTAAHNIIYYLDRNSPRELASALVGVSMGDHVVVPIMTTRGLLHVAPYVIEAGADIAVLGPLDNQVFGEQVEAYEDWCEAVSPVPLCLDDFPVQASVPVAVFTHRGTWLAGTAEQAKPWSSALWVTVPDGIEGGTSGSPILSATGEIVCLVSQMGGSEPDALLKGRSGPAPRPHLTLPIWVMHQIQAGEDPERYETPPR